MKAKNTEFLPLQPSLETRNATLENTSIPRYVKKQSASFAEILRTHKNNKSLLEFERMLNRASCISASHLYIEPEESTLRVRYRTSTNLNEELLAAENNAFDTGELLSALYENAEDSLRFTESKTIKACLGSAHYDLNIMPLRTAWSLSLTVELKRAIHLAPTLDEMEIPHFILKQLRDILNKKSGLFLLVGPQASGKQFSRLAILQDLNTPERKIVSIEEQPNIAIPRVSHVSMSYEQGKREEFADYILQHAPDVCSIDHITQGDMLTPFLNSTLNSTMLVASAHALTAIDALEQLYAVGCDKHIIAQSLNGILTQRKLPNVCPDCKKVYRLNSTDKKWIQQNFPGELIIEGRFTTGEGCERCSNTGLFGSSKIYELIASSDELRSAIVEGSRSGLTTAISFRSNFQTLRQKAFSLANDGIIPLHQVMTV